MKIKLTIQFLILSTLLLLSVSCSESKIAGGETANQAFIGITVFKSDGITPAAGAKVKLFTPGDTSKTPLDMRELDENGQLDPKDLVLNGNTPYHNMLIELDSTEALYYDSLFITEDNYSFLKDDTLAPVGAISGVVAIQPNHTPIAVLVHALGTDIYTKVDGETGEFSIGGLAEGKYNLMFTCSYDEYDVELFDTLALSGKVTAVPDTIEIPFLGIPVVKNIQASYDTLSGRAMIDWEYVSYDQFSYYQVFRTTDPLNWPSIPIGRTTTNNFSDAFNSFSSTVYYYRVMVQNRSGQIGLPFDSDSVKVVSPVLAQTAIDGYIFHKGKQQITSAVSINDSISLYISANNPTRKFSSVALRNITTGVLIDSTAFNVAVPTFSDTLDLFIDTVNQQVAVTVIDNAGTEWRDTITVTIDRTGPVIHCVDSIVYKGIQDTIHLQVSDMYEQVVSYEWDVNSDGVYDSITTDPSLPFLTDSLIYNDSIRVRVVNADGDADSIVQPFRTEFYWEEVGQLPSNFGRFGRLNFFEFQGKLIKQDYTGYLWSSLDGITWEKVSDSIAPLYKSNDGEVEYIHEALADNFFVYNGYVWTSHREKSNDPDKEVAMTLLKSSDLINWSTVFTNNISLADDYIPGDHPSLIATNAGLFSNGVLSDMSLYSKKLAKSDDGLTWNSINNNFSFMTFTQEAYLVSNNRNIYTVENISSDTEVNLAICSENLTPLKSIKIPTPVGLDREHPIGMECLNNNIIIALDSRRVILYDVQKESPYMCGTIAKEIGPQHATVSGRFLSFNNQFFFYRYDYEKGYTSIWRAK